MITLPYLLRFRRCSAHNV